MYMIKLGRIFNPLFESINLEKAMKSAILVVVVTLLAACSPPPPEYVNSVFSQRETLRPVAPAYLVLIGTHDVCRLWGGSAELTISEVWTREKTTDYSAVATVTKVGEVYADPSFTAQPTRQTRECKEGEVVVLHNSSRSEFVKS